MNDTYLDIICDFVETLDSPKKYSCNICTKSFERLHVYRKHMSSHGEVVPLKFKRKADTYLDKTTDNMKEKTKDFKR